MVKATFSLRNFGKHNTPRWAEQLGNFALVLGGFFSAIATTCLTLESLPLDTINSLPFVATTIAIGKTCGVWGVIICGGVKTFSKFFGIPLKDIHQ